MPTASERTDSLGIAQSLFVDGQGEGAAHSTN
jgi:hypothetical protein